MRLERVVTVDVATESWGPLRDPLFQAAGSETTAPRIDAVKSLEESSLEALPSLVITSLDAAASSLELLRESGALVPVVVLVPRRSVARALELLDRHAVLELLPVPRPSIFDVRRVFASLERRIDEAQRCRELEARLRETREALRGAESSAGELSERLRRMGREQGSPEQEYTRRRIEESIDMAQRYGVPLTCLLVGLEPIAGSAPADVELARIAGRLKRCVRSTDLMTLDSEDRFLIVSPFTDRRSAEALARRLREEIRDDPQIRLRVGIAALDDTVRDAEALTRRAAEALEHARRQDSGIESL